MASVVAGLLRRIIKVRIEGNINQKLADKVTQDFHTARFYNPQAVVVTINSTGGSLTQAKNISDLLKSYSSRNNTPIYCFAEDQCLGSANLILTTGVKCYANQMTMLGDFGFQWGTLWFKKFADKYNMKIDYVYSGQNKVKFNPFEQIKPESEKWMKNYLFQLEHDLKCNVVNNRQKAFTKKQMSKKDIEQKLFKSCLVEPAAAVDSGYIDGIMNVDSLLNSTLAGVRVYQVNKRDKYGRIRKMLEYAHLTN